MTAKNRTTLKNDLENGDTFDATIAGDLVDSALNVADTTAQAMSSDLTGPKFIATTEVSAPSIRTSAAVIGGTVSASSMYTSTLFVGGGQVQAGGGGDVGQLVITATAETSIGSAGTYELVNGTVTVKPPTVEFSALSTPELKYKGAIARNFLVQAAMSMTAALGSKLSSIAPSVGASARTEFEIERLIGTGSDQGALSFSAVLSANVSASLGVMVANKTDSTNLTAEKLVLTVVQV